MMATVPPNFIDLLNGMSEADLAKLLASGPKRDPLIRVQAVDDVSLQFPRSTTFDTGRTFVCQGCGNVAVVLHGRSMKCSCGVVSAAEVIVPR